MKKIVFTGFLLLIVLALVACTESYKGTNHIKPSTEVTETVTAVSCKHFPK